MKLYIYTYLDPDGQDFIDGPRTRMEPPDLQNALGGKVDVIPKNYYRHHGWRRCTVYFSEDGRAGTGNKLNPNFRDLGDGFNVMGVALKEQPYHGTY